ncbi:MAG: hypothetical protein Q7V88_17525 [Actinomycetota bacterium]|nr:hypothetical protein [Actinomycetota bacterium]
MFTTGSKLFFGATALSLVGAIVYSASTDGPSGTMGTIGLLSAAAVFGFLAGINFSNRDGNVPAMQQGVELTSAAAARPVRNSIWPLIAAVGAAGLVVGAVSKPVVFKVAVVAVLAALVEWMVQGWSERASDDPQHNDQVRRRMLYPLEFPILAAAGGGAIVYALSRVLLASDKDLGKIVFGIIAVLVLFGGFVFAGKRHVKRSTVTAVCTVGAVALLGVGVASAVQGQRTIDEHPTTATNSAVCLEEGSEAEIDEHASQDVSAKSSVLAHVYLQSDGSLVVQVTGYTEPPSTLTVPRSTPVTVLFHNDFSSPERLTGRFGTFGTAPEAIQCTTAVNPGKTAFLNFEIPRGNAASSSDLEFLVPGTGSTIVIVVP